VVTIQPLAQRVFGTLSPVAKLPVTVHHHPAQCLECTELYLQLFMQLYGTETLGFNLNNLYI
jgi:hypothetical protein